MNFIQQLTVSNYLCYREETTFDFSHASYYIGVNNSGKSAVLKAIRTFFEEKITSQDLNKTEYQGKGSGFNKCSIQICFDITQLIGKEYKKRMITKYGNTIVIKKDFIYKVKSGNVETIYHINGKRFLSDGLDDDINKLLQSVKISYIHPQEGKELFQIAQNKLRERLLSKWGQHKEMSQTITEIQDQWIELKTRAEKYLSSMLSTSLQKVWDGCEVNIELPKTINDIIGVSDISFKRNKADTPIPLTYQGTGAQVSVLYQTHYILDSDRSLHQGEYHPLLLVEEPESFLHADVLVKQAVEFSSNEWLQNIQLFITTHSPLLLAKSKQNMEKIKWTLLDDAKQIISKNIVEWTNEEIKQIGKLLGDSNFEVYFFASANEKQVFLEDSKQTTINVFTIAGIKITKGLNGTSEVKKYIEVLLDNTDLVPNEVVFFVDKDQGYSKDIQKYCIGKRSSRGTYFDAIQIHKKIKVITTKDGKTVEDLFAEWDKFIEKCYDGLFEKGKLKKTGIDDYLTSAYLEIRPISNSRMDEIKSRLKRNDLIKSEFWKIVETEKYQLKKDYMDDFKKLL